MVNNGQVGDHVTSATIAHLTGEKLKAMPIPLPPFELQVEFSKKLDAVRGIKELHQTSHRQIDSMFSSLQHRAFRGEL